MKRILATLATAGLLTAALVTGSAPATAGHASPSTSQLPLENEPIVWGGNAGRPPTARQVTC